MRKQRNKVNGLIECAKCNYILNSLRLNTRNPKKFWRIVNDMLKGTSSISQTVQFIDPDTNATVSDVSQSDYLNTYFCDIAGRLGLRIDSAIDPEITNDLDAMYGNIDSIFDLGDDEITPIELEMIAKDIDTSKSSCIPGLSTHICKKNNGFFSD